MKKYLLIVGFLGMLAGCQDSTSDVDIASRHEVVAEPDTVIISDGVKVEMYMPDNPRAIAQTFDLAEHAGVRAGFATFKRAPRYDDARSAFVMRAIGTDGRILDATWFPIDGELGLNAVVHARMDGREFVVPIRAGDGIESEPEVFESNGKGDWGPSRIFAWGRCAILVGAIYVSCFDICTQATGSSGCVPICTSAAAAAWGTCIVALEQ